MFGSGAQAYTRVRLETDVLDNSPHRLVQLLFEGARVAVASAKLQATPADRGRLISKAISIITEGLKGALDLSSGELALSLDELYDYMVRRLLEGNLKGDLSTLDEVHARLAELETAWNEIPVELRS